jgi:Zn-dependent metalloprotease
MNEGYSDVWGACVEHFEKNRFTWWRTWSRCLASEDIGGSGVHYVLWSIPNSEGDPDTYLGLNWTITADEGVCVPDRTINDYCGVHTNSGVLNHWFYILTAGAAGTNNATNLLDRDTYVGE